MKLYADLPAARARQIAGDAVALAWTGAWALAGRAVYRVVEEVTSASRSVEDAGLRFSSTLDDVSTNVGRVPLAGPALRQPFSGAAEAGRSLADAGSTSGDAIHDLALWLGLLVALLPIVWLLARWLPDRVRWARDAAVAATLDLELLATRAVARRSLVELSRTPNETTALAALELRAMGLRGP